MMVYRKYGTCRLQGAPLRVSDPTTFSMNGDFNHTERDSPLRRENVGNVSRNYVEVVFCGSLASFYNFSA
jgi:hypothetical protein